MSGAAGSVTRAATRAARHALPLVTRSMFFTWSDRALHTWPRPAGSSPGACQTSTLPGLCARLGCRLLDVILFTRSLSRVMGYKRQFAL